jgi:IclR family pca regulon transcriptional regulator
MEDVLAVGGEDLCSHSGESRVLRTFAHGGGRRLPLGDSVIRVTTGTRHDAVGTYYEEAREVVAARSEERDERDYVHSLARGLAVIRSFDREHAEMTSSEVAERTDLNRAAARRFLLTLVREGYAETDGKRFRLRPQVLELGYAALSSLSFAEIATPSMQELSNRVEETCLAVVLDGRDVVYIAKTTSRRIVNVSIEVGSRIPAYSVSSGRVLLAALTDDELDRYLATAEPVRHTETTVVDRGELRALVLAVRESGWAIVDQEYEIGFRSLSVPVRDRSGATVAALNLSCPSPRVALETMRVTFLPALLDTAARVGSLLPEGFVRRRGELARAGATAT